MPVARESKPLVIPFVSLRMTTVVMNLSGGNSEISPGRQTNSRPLIFTTPDREWVTNITFHSQRSVDKKSGDNRWPQSALNPPQQMGVKRVSRQQGCICASAILPSYSRHSEKKPIVHIASDIAVTASFTGSSR